MVDGEQSIGCVAGFSRVGDPSAGDPVAQILAYSVLIGRLDKSIADVRKKKLSCLTSIPGIAECG